GVVQQLLSLSPSAIHIRFVWRHLVRYHQNKLDPFINAQKSFRGVFYLPANLRGPLPGTKKAVAIAARLAAKQEAAGGGPAAARGEKMTVYFEDYFMLPACFGMHRLLPRQSEALAAQRVATIMNPNRDLPSRVKAMIMYTLLPTVTYADIVDFIETQQQLSKA